MASESGDTTPSERVSGTDEYRLKNVTFKDYLPHLGVQHTPPGYSQSSLSVLCGRHLSCAGVMAPASVVVSAMLLLLVL